MRFAKCVRKVVHHIRTLALFLASTVSALHRNAHIWNAPHPLRSIYEFTHIFGVDKCIERERQSIPLQVRTRKRIHEDLAECCCLLQRGLQSNKILPGNKQASASTARVEKCKVAISCGCCHHVEVKQYLVVRVSCLFGCKHGTQIQYDFVQIRPRMACNVGPAAGCERGGSSFRSVSDSNAKVVAQINVFQILHDKFT
jgi:hypothetical protein